MQYIILFEGIHNASLLRGAIHNGVFSGTPKGFFKQTREFYNIDKNLVMPPKPLLDFDKEGKTYETGSYFVRIKQDIDGNPMYKDVNPMIVAENNYLKDQMNMLIRHIASLQQDLYTLKSEDRIQERLLQLTKLFGKVRSNMYSFDSQQQYGYPFSRFGGSPLMQPEG